MSKGFTFYELFAGAGGLSSGLELAGWQCVGHAEIEPHARAVLRHQWPDVRLDGDVSGIDGTQLVAELGPITLLSGGSPCQDLSVAGKRKGMTEGSGTRSALFYEQLRLWNETQAPYLLWENVLGALSSNDGRDFAAVLSAIVGSTVTVPGDGWKGGGGVVAGRTGVAAWRVLDCQFFGPPQRRRRVFVIGARAGSVDPAEVLSLAESVRGHLETGRETGEGVASDVAEGARSHRVVAFKPSHFTRGKDGAPSEIAAPLSADADRGDQEQVVLAFDSKGTAVQVEDDLCPPLRAMNHDAGNANGAGQVGVCTFDVRGNGDGKVVNTLSGDHQNRVTDYTALVIDKASGQPEQGDVAPTLTTDLSHNMGPIVMSSGQANAEIGEDVSTALTALTALHEAPILFQPVAVSISDGKASVESIMGTLGTRSGGSEVGAQTRGVVIAPPVTAGAHPGSYNGMDAVPVADAILSASATGRGRPRRLMPIECERLMGWPDQHTAFGVNERGVRYALADSARYRLCGNGVAKPQVAWIGFELRSAITAQENFNAHP